MADERPPEGTDRPVDDAPAPDPVWRPPDEAGTDPTERVDLPWQQPPVPPAELPQLTAEPLQPPASAEPRSTIISAEPVLTERGEAARPEVAWAPPPAARVGREVPGAPAFELAGALPRVVAWIVDEVLVIIGPIIVLFIVALAVPGAFQGTQNVELTTTLFGIAWLGTHFLYFFSFWTGSRRATPGMRVMQLQLGTAFEGRTLSVRQAIVRWLAFGQWIGLVASVGPLAGVGTLVAVLWPIALLVSTATSPTKQGLHDIAAGSAVVRPKAVGMGAAGVACLVIVALILLFAVLPLVSLIFLGGQIEQILSEVGESI